MRKVVKTVSLVLVLCGVLISSGCGSQPSNVLQVDKILAMKSPAIVNYLEGAGFTYDDDVIGWGGDASQVVEGADSLAITFGDRPEWGDAFRKGEWELQQGQPLKAVNVVYRTKATGSAQKALDAVVAAAGFKDSLGTLGKSGSSLAADASTAWFKSDIDGEPGVVEVDAIIDTDGELLVIVAARYLSDITKVYEIENTYEAYSARFKN